MDPLGVGEVSEFVCDDFLFQDIAQFHVDVFGMWESIQVEVGDIQGRELGTTVGRNTTIKTELGNKHASS